MNTQNRHPRWWQLSLLIPLMLGLLLVDTHMRLSAPEHQIIEVGVVLLMYGAMACWLWANQAALESEAEQPGRRQSLDSGAECAAGERSMPTWLEQNATGPSQVAEPAPLPAEYQQVFSKEVISCAPPSGARLN